MVKGVSKRVIIVRPKNGAAFEQAIFIVREDSSNRDILREACAVAESYVERTVQNRILRRYTKYQLILSAICGAILTGGIWLLTMLLPQIT